MPRVVRKPLRYLCHATLNGQTVAGPHPDPNEVERQAWDVIREQWRHYTAEREVSHVGSVRLIVRGVDGFPVEIVYLHKGLFEVEE